MSVLEPQLRQLQAEFPNARVAPQPDGSALVTIPDIRLPSDAWNQQTATVYFLAPAGFPVARPDCFWADGGLRLANGGLPQNSSPQNTAFGANLLWFSWHVAAWNPQDTLRTFLRVIEERFRRGN